MRNRISCLFLLKLERLRFYGDFQNFVRDNLYRYLVGRSFHLEDFEELIITLITARKGAASVHAADESRESPCSF